MESSVFWNVTLRSPLKVNRRFGGTYRPHLQGRIIPAVSLPPAFTLVSCFACYSTLNMQSTCSSEKSVDFQRTKRRYIPEDRTLHNHRCKVKGKVVTVLNELSTMPWRRMGCGCIDPHFLDLGTSWRWVVSFTPRPLYPQGNSPRYPLDRRLDGPQSWSGRRGEDKILDPTGTRTPTPRSPNP
jgi:hypothetical protein